MVKGIYHPNAHLSNIRNIGLGLQARTRILAVLEKRPGDVKSVAKESNMSCRVVMHHLKLLREEGIVERKGSKPHIWVLTGLGQKRLVNSG